MTGISKYDPGVGTATGNRTRLRARAGGVDDDVRRHMAAGLVAQDCAEGRHRTETDADTGDEVCRFCPAVVEP